VNIFKTHIGHILKIPVPLRLGPMFGIVKCPYYDEFFPRKESLRVLSIPGHYQIKANRYDKVFFKYKHQNHLINHLYKNLTYPNDNNII
jgi:hypothetical protein